MDVYSLELTEQNVLDLAGASQLDKIHTLNLTGSFMPEEEAEQGGTSLFARMPALKTLVLAKNGLSDFPIHTPLNSLTSLDLTGNQLTSLDFITLCPNLQRLSIEGNKIKIADKYIALESCPSLQHIDNKAVAPHRSIIQRMTDRITDQLSTVWEREFSRTYSQGVSPEKLPSIKSRLRSQASCDDGTGHTERGLAGFEDYLIHKCMQRLLEDVQTGNYQPPSKKTRVPGIRVKPVRKTRTQAEKKGVATTTLPSVPDYSPLHCVRCHSSADTCAELGVSDTDPRDYTTKVWHCAMEPHRDNPDSDTGLVATCGGEVVCLIDCSTGRVLQRFRQPGEQFFALAWTTLALDTEAGERRTNILAVGGYDAHIKLIHPEQKVCYKEWGTGRPNRSVPIGGYHINALVFHPQEPTWMFAAASDAAITLWDIGVPSGEKHHTEVKPLTVFFGDNGSIINLVLSPHTGHLVAGAEDGLEVWKLPKPDQTLSKRQTQRADLELPCEAGLVDGLALLDSDTVACKCVSEGCIYIWRLSETLQKGKVASTRIKPLVTLDWASTEVDYIFMSARSGRLVCGDDEGRVWLYNTQQLLDTPRRQLPASDTVLAPSRLLLWPECQIRSERKQEQAMLDVLDHSELPTVNTVCISADGRYIVSGTDTNLVCVWGVCHEEMDTC